MRSAGTIAGTIALGFALGVGLGPSSAARAEVTIAISCSSLGQEQELCRSGAEAWAQQTGNRVELISTPADANERLSLYQTLLAAGSPDVDVFQIDVIWPGSLASHFVDLGDHIPAEALQDHFDQLLANNTVEDQLVAVPWFVDAGLLYYREDLLEKHGRAVPKTWQELTETAKAVLEAERAAGASELQGFVWQGRAYEGLTCNALEWIASQGGGGIVDADGRVTIDNEQAVSALDLAQSWIGSISPRGILNYAEEDARGAFQSGRALFMRNWPYAWALANADDSPVKGKVGVAALPAGEGGKPAATLGGQQLAVSRYSAHPEEAADLVRYLTGYEEQKRRALEGSFNPTRRSLYDDEALLAANPFYGTFLDILESAVARPSTVTGRRYNQLSSEFVRAVHATLSGNGTAAENLTALGRALERLSRGGRW
ncbi:MAG: extracellular solute-binding protein [Kiloniellaceae bacterium]|nr:extracellular solute-binding protein [Kiloniellaceae bacterium]